MDLSELVQPVIDNLHKYIADCMAKIVALELDPGSLRPSQVLGEMFKAYDQALDHLKVLETYDQGNDVQRLARRIREGRQLLRDATIDANQLKAAEHVLISYWEQILQDFSLGTAKRLFLWDNRLQFVTVSDIINWSAARIHQYRPGGDMDLPTWLSKLQEAAFRQDRQAFYSLVDQMRKDPGFTNNQNLINEIVIKAQKFFEEDRAEDFVDSSLSTSDSVKETTLSSNFPSPNVSDELKYLDEELETSVPSPVKIWEKVNSLRRKLGQFKPEERDKFRQLEQRFKQLRQERVLELKAKLGVVKDQIENILTDDDPEKYLALKVDPIQDGRSILKSIEEWDPTDSELSFLSAQLAGQETQIVQVKILAEYRKEIYDLWKLGEHAESAGAERTLIINPFKDAQSKAALINSPAEQIRNHLTRPGVLNHLSALKQRADEKYQAVTVSHEMPTTKLEVSELASLILDWRKQIASESQKKVSYFSDVEGTLISTQPLEKALEIAERRLKAMRRAKIEEYTAEVRSILNDPRRSPEDARAVLERINGQLRLKDSELSLALDGDSQNSIDTITKKVENAASIRSQVIVACVESRRSDISVIAAWKQYQSADAKRRQEEIARGLQQELEIPELKQAFQRMAQRAQEEYEKSLSEAEERYDKGSWRICREKLNAAEEIYKIYKNFSTDLDSERTQLDYIDGRLKLIQTALENMRKVTGEKLDPVKSELEKLYAEFESEGGKEFVLKWRDFSSYQNSVDAYFNAEKVVLRFEVIAQAGDSYENLVEAELKAGDAQKGLPASHQSRLQQALAGIRAWIVLRKAEADQIRPNQLNPALNYPATRALAESQRKRLQERMADQKEVKRAREQIKASLSVADYQGAYELAQQWSKKNSDAQDEFLDKVDEIRSLWETDLTRKIDQELRDYLRGQLPDSDPTRPLNTDDLKYEDINQYLKSLREIESSHLQEYLKKAELPAAEAEARVKLQLSVTGVVRRESVIQACQKAFELAQRYGKSQRAYLWANKRLEQRKEMVLSQVRKIALGSSSQPTLMKNLDELEALRNEFEGKDAEIWLELAKIHLELGKRENQWQ